MNHPDYWKGVDSVAAPGVGGASEAFEDRVGFVFAVFVQESASAVIAEYLEFLHTGVRVEDDGFGIECVQVRDA